MICGVQWPATNTGSSHSIAATGTGSAPRTASRTRVDPRALAGDEVDAASRAPVAWASVRTSPNDSPSVVRVERDHVRRGRDRLGDAATSS